MHMFRTLDEESVVIASLFGPEAVVLEATPALVDGQLLPDEWAFIRSAGPKRRAEFGTARILARGALSRMGFPPIPLVPASDRSPTWPAGVVGSITHTRGHCLVVLERSPPAMSVGIDIERLSNLDEGMLAHFLTPTERTWIEMHTSQARNDLAILLFSAKEAYYKCQYPVSSRLLDFLDVEIVVDLGERRFRAQALAPELPPQVSSLDGRFCFRSGTVVCGIELFRSPSFTECG
jgi:4'-phosphopantetheinyl transferase EntD